MDSLKTYSATVQQFVDYSSTATEAMADFDNLIDLIKVEIRNLEEKRYQLNEAGAVIENKIAECEAKIESTQSYIADLEEDLAAVQAEIEDTDDTITIPDFDGNSYEIPNAKYISLTKKEAVLEGKILSAHNELVELEKQLSRCGSIKRELSTVLSEVEKQIETLSSNIRCVEKNKSEYRSTVANVKIHSTIASSKLSMIEQTLNNYIGIQLKVIPAFDSIKKEGVSKNLNELSYFSAKFKNTLSINNQRKKNTSFIRDGKKYFTDDHGNVYRCGDELLPNNEYVINGYKYKTDEMGRVISAEGEVQKKAHEGKLAIKDSIKTVGHGDAKKTDDRGHIIGDQLNGSPGMENLVAQDAKINQGAYKNLEDRIAKAVTEGHDVDIKVEPIYGDKLSYRPTEIKYTYTIDGEKNITLFPNGR